VKRLRNQRYCPILPDRTSLTDRLECRPAGPVYREAFALHAGCLDTLAALALDMTGKVGTLRQIRTLPNQPAEIVAAATASIREALTPHLDGASVRPPGAMWLVSSAPA